MHRHICGLIKLAVLILVFAPALADAKTVLVTGGNRGIGLEFVNHYAAAGHTVIATARNPSRADDLNAMAATNPAIKVEELDVNDFEEIDALAAKYADTPIDILINNAGITGRPDRQRFGTIDYST